MENFETALNSTITFKNAIAKTSRICTAPINLSPQHPILTSPTCKQTFSRHQDAYGKVRNVPHAYRREHRIRVQAENKKRWWRKHDLLKRFWKAASRRIFQDFFAANLLGRFDRAHCGSHPHVG